MLSIDKCHCFSMRKATRAISQLYDDRLAPTGLRITQFLSLATINELKGISVNRLAEKLQIDRTTMSKNLLPLEREKLIEISRSAADARAKVIILTADGQARLREAVPLWREAQRHFEETLGASIAGLENSLRATNEFRDDLSGG